MLETWDPLNTGAELDTALLANAKKREIKNILKSYVGFFDSFSELIQNAMDAVDKRYNDLKESTYTKKIWISINLQNNSLSITDNGIGFEESQFKSFIAPNISYKADSKTRGNKGVGATYLAYGFDYLQFGTKTKNFKNIVEIENGRTWIEDNNSIVSRPQVKKSELIDNAFNSIDRGSTFTLKFDSKYSRPKNLSWIQATEVEQWKYLLLIKTPLGMLDFIERQKNEKIYFDLTIIKDNGSISSLLDQEAIYIFPHKEIDHSVDLKKVLSEQQSAVQLGKDPEIISNKYKRSNGLYEYFDHTELKDIIKDDAIKQVINDYNINVYGYFAYSTDLWDSFSDNIAKLRKGYRLIKGGLQIANNNMVQGDLITIPLTSNIGYQNQCHIVIHLNGADPDLGRKGFQPEIKTAAEKISVSIVNRLKTWKKLLRENTGASPTTVRATELHDWIRLQEEHEKASKLSITNKNFFIPVNKISIVSSPQSEQDVIVLFNQLIAGGVIRGISLLATNQSTQYDGVFRFTINPPHEHLFFDKDKNPLGIDKHQITQETFTSKPFVLEYKYSIDGLISDFDNDEKSPRDIEMAIAWDIGTQWQKNYEITSLLDYDNMQHRDFHGLTHIMQSNGVKIKLVILKELIEYLNDSDGVQAFHKSEYSY